MSELFKLLGNINKENSSEKKRHGYFFFIIITIFQFTHDILSQIMTRINVYIAILCARYSVRMFV